MMGKFSIWRFARFENALGRLTGLLINCQRDLKAYPRHFLTNSKSRSTVGKKRTGVGMGYFSKCIGAAFAMFAAASAAAQAQDCPPLVKITSVKLEALANSRKMLVPVTINNVPKKFLLDTAGMSGYITKESADEMKLEQVFGLREFKVVKTMGLGGRTFELPNTGATDGALIAPEYPVSSDRDGNIDGTLTNGFLLNKGELDIDFPGGTLNLFSFDHCPGKVNYWGAPDIGFLPLGHAPVELGQQKTGIDGWYIAPADFLIKNDISHLTVPVTLDGHLFNQVLFRQVEKSSISIEVAERIFNLPKKDLGPPSEVKVTPEAALGFYNPHILSNGHFTQAPNSPVVARPTVYRHKFSALSLGPIDIKNLELLVIPDRWGRNNDVARRLFYTPKIYSHDYWTMDIAGEGDNRGEITAYSNAKKEVPDMVLGMDVLRHLHIYLSLKEERMYFSVGASPPPPSAPNTVAR